MLQVGGLGNAKRAETRKGKPGTGEGSAKGLSGHKAGLRKRPIRKGEFDFQVLGSL